MHWTLVAAHLEPMLDQILVLYNMPPSLQQPASMPTIMRSWTRLDKMVMEQPERLDAATGWYKALLSKFTSEAGVSYLSGNLHHSLALVARYPPLLSTVAKLLEIPIIRRILSDGCGRTWLDRRRCCHDVHISFVFRSCVDIDIDPEQVLDAVIKEAVTMLERVVEGTEYTVFDLEEDDLCGPLVKRSGPWDWKVMETLASQGRLWAKFGGLAAVERARTPPEGYTSLLHPPFQGSPPKQWGTSGVRSSLWPLQTMMLTFPNVCRDSLDLLCGKYIESRILLGSTGGSQTS
jgi:hypothetical protein